MAQIIRGKELAALCKQQVAERVKALEERGVKPCLAVVLVGENPASKVYVAGKEKDCAECGILSRVLRMPETTTQEELLDTVKVLNEDESVHGILVQLPLPEHLSAQPVIETIAPEKDVDGFTPINTGLVSLGDARAFYPCTPSGCMKMLYSVCPDLTGKRAVVLGRSNIVGKPMASLLLAADCTVTMCHSKTKDLAQICRNADILVAAIGKAKFVTKEFVGKDAIVIDVGMNRDENGKLCGDVDFDSVEPAVYAITPVPGGVGLMTRAVLMENTVKAAENACKTLA